MTTVGSRRARTRPDGWVDGAAGWHRGMSAQPSEHDSHDVIRLGGETAVVVPVHEYHTLKALRDRASAEQVEEAEIDAAIAEHEIIILWTDYFRPEHAEKYPQLHDLVWKTCKLTSTVKQQVNAQAAQDLLAGIQQIAEIFWETKGVKTKRVPSGQPTGGEIVQPVLG